MNPVTKALNKYAVPMLDQLSFGESSHQGALKVETEDHKNFSDYLYSVQGFYTYSRMNTHSTSTQSPLTTKDLGKC